MTRNEPRNSEAKESYQKWLSKKDAVQKLKTRIEKVGFPLEVMVRNALEKRAYYINSERHYEHRNVESNETILREIDISAEKGFELNLPECTISIDLRVIAECKYSSTNDFFIFESHEKSLYRKFPILLTSQQILSYTHDYTDYVKFPIIAQNIAAADTTSANFFPEDKTIFDASTQVTNALAFLAKSTNESHAALYADDEEEYLFIEKYEERVRELNFKRQNYVGTEEIMNYEKEMNKDLLKRLAMYWIPIWVPIVILGKNNGLLKVIMKEDEVQDFQDVGYCIYPFTPTKVPDYFRKKHITEIPIVISNMNYLDRCLNDIEIRIEKIIENIKQSINANPFKVCEAAYNEYQYIKPKKGKL